MNTTAYMIGYGRSEVRAAGPRNFVLGMMVSVAMHFIIIYAYIVDFSATPVEPPTVRLRVIKYNDLGPPPSIANSYQPPAVGISARRARPTVGMPVPVPDLEVRGDQTLATQKEMSMGNVFGEGDGTGEGTGEAAGNEAVDYGNITIDPSEEEPDMDEFVPVEKEPMIITSVTPQYPEIARLAGIEGVVWVKVLIGKDGKPKKAVVLKAGPVESLNQAAIDAAMQYTFTPAVMNAGPVPVWMALKFRFQLKAQKS